MAREHLAPDLGELGFPRIPQADRAEHGQEEQRRPEDDQPELAPLDRLREVPVERPHLPDLVTEELVEQLVRERARAVASHLDDVSRFRLG